MEKIASQHKQSLDACPRCGSHRRWADGRCAKCAEERADARKKNHVPGSLKPGYVRVKGEVVRKKDVRKGPLPFSKGGPCKTCGNISSRWKDGTCAPCGRRRAREAYARKKLDPEAFKAFMQKQAQDAKLRKDHELVLGTQDRHEYRMKATPKWLKIEHVADIEATYYKARLLTRRTGKKHVVEYIVPLKHPLICGLHVPWNLRVTTASEVAKKRGAEDDDPDSFI